LNTGCGARATTRASAANRRAHESAADDPESPARLAAFLQGLQQLGFGPSAKTSKSITAGLRHVAVIFNPGNAPFAKLFNQAIEAAAQSLGVSVTLVPVHDDAAIEAAVAAQSQQPGGGVIVLPESFVITHRRTIIAAAARYRLPTFGMNDLFPRDGGLMSYSIDSVDTYDRVPPISTGFSRARIRLIYQFRSQRNSC
jgi:DNA-binding LacI/PurR family transcriptional regulator